jgi:uncharacterized protein YutE (UPF0331/DUF86 family)
MESAMVDHVLVERILNDIKIHIRDLRDADDITWELYLTDKRARRFVERTLHILVEACIDIAQHIISDERLREPVSYRDTFAILAEAGVLNPLDISTFEAMAGFRNLIVHYYERVDDSVVFGIFKKRLGDFELYADQIVAYLKKTR